MKTRMLFSVVVVGLMVVCGLSLVGGIACHGESTTPPACCPKCGCRECLVPVCHITCTTKQEKKYRYCCKCETICIPDHCSCTSDGCCKDNCDCKKCDCLIKDVYKLVKIPYTVDVPVRKCTIEWTCPKCGCNCGCTEKSDATSPTAVPMTSSRGQATMTTPTLPAIFRLNVAEDAASAQATDQ